MKFIYPAVFRKTDKGTYKGFFPDLEDCFGEGDTLDEAIEEANAAGDVTAVAYYTRLAGQAAATE